MIDAQLLKFAPLLTLALVVVVILLFYRFVARLFGVVIVPEDSAGIVNKKYALVVQRDDGARRDCRPTRSRRASTSVSGRGSTS